MGDFVSGEKNLGHCEELTGRLIWAMSVGNSSSSSHGSLELPLVLRVHFFMHELLVQIAKTKCLARNLMVDPYIFLES